MIRLLLALLVSLGATLPARAAPASNCNLTLLLAANPELSTVLDELAGLRISIDDADSSGNSALASSLEPDFEKSLSALHQTLIASQPSTAITIDVLRRLIAQRARELQGHLQHQASEETRRRTTISNAENQAFFWLNMLIDTRETYGDATVTGATFNKDSTRLLLSGQIGGGSIFAGKTRYAEVDLTLPPNQWKALPIHVDRDTPGGVPDFPERFQVIYTRDRKFAFYRGNGLSWFDPNIRGGKWTSINTAIYNRKGKAQDIRNFTKTRDDKNLFLAGRTIVSWVDISTPPSNWIAREIDTRDTHGDLWIRSITTSPDGKHLVLTGGGGKVSVWNIPILLETLSARTK